MFSHSVTASKLPIAFHGVFKSVAIMSRKKNRTNQFGIKFYA